MGYDASFYSPHHLFWKEGITSKKFEILFCHVRSVIA